MAPNHASPLKNLSGGESVIGDNPTSTVWTGTAEPIKKPSKINKILTVNEVRKDFSDTLNAVAFTGEHQVLMWKGKPLAVIVPSGTIQDSFVTDTTTSAAARDNISDILNRIRFKEDVINVNRRDKALVTILSIKRFNSIAISLAETNAKDDPSLNSGNDQSNGGEPNNSSKAPKRRANRAPSYKPPQSLP